MDIGSGEPISDFPDSADANSLGFRRQEREESGKDGGVSVDLDGESQPWGSVRVAVRIRPMIGSERVAGCSPCVEVPAITPNQVTMANQKSFGFDYVFKPESSQAEVYSQCAEPLVARFIQGYNITVLAYGQTSSGKTYTMGTGSVGSVMNHEKGIVPRVIDQIFDSLHGKLNSSDAENIQVCVSFVEIHNEEIRDLLCPTAGDSIFQSDSKKTITIREGNQGEIILSGVAEREASSREELLGFLDEGSIYRSTGSTMMNAHSSRSHAIFTILLKQTRLIDPEGDPNDDSNIEYLNSKFNFVDLAGSERLKRTKAVGERMKEGISINCGLLALGNVISALGDPKRKGSHVPFRSSKITRLLQDSLGGNSQTLMIACISPADVNFDETLNTLRYANRARNIKNKPVINRDHDSQRVVELMDYIAKLEGVIKANGISVDLCSKSLPKSDTDQLRIQNETLENEVARLTEMNKRLRLESSQAEDRAIAAERERDITSQKMAHVLEKANLSPSTMDEFEIDERDYDIMRKNNEKIQSLESEISTLRAQLSSNHHVYESSSPSVRRLSSSYFSTLFDSSKTDVLTDEENGDESSRCDRDAALQESMDHANDELNRLQLAKEEKEKEFQFLQNNNDMALRNLDLELKSKEDLVKALLKAKENIEMMKLQYEKKIHEMEFQIVQVQEQRDSILDKFGDKNANQVDLERERDTHEKKLVHLKDQLSSYKDKLKESIKAMQIKAKDDVKIRSLQDEIFSIRNQKVKLQKKIKEDAEKHREWRQELEREVKSLVKKSRQAQIEMQKMQSRVAQNEIILKRKVEENASLHRQLKESRMKTAGHRTMPKSAAVKSLKSLISLEIQNAVKKFALSEELNMLNSQREQLQIEFGLTNSELVQQKRVALASKDSDADICNLEDRLENITDEISFVEQRMSELHKNINSLGCNISDLTRSKSFKADRKFFERAQLNRLEDAKSVILSLMDKIIAVTKDKQFRESRVEQLENELSELQKELRVSEVAFDASISLNKRHIDSVEAHMIDDQSSELKEVIDYQQHEAVVDEEMEEKYSRSRRDSRSSVRSIGSQDGNPSDVGERLYNTYTDNWRSRLKSNKVEEISLSNLFSYASASSASNRRSKVDGSNSDIELSLDDGDDESSSSRSSQVKPWKVSRDKSLSSELLQSKDSVNIFTQTSDNESQKFNLFSQVPETSLSSRTRPQHFDVFGSGIVVESEDSDKKSLPVENNIALPSTPRPVKSISQITDVFNLSNTANPILSDVSEESSIDLLGPASALSPIVEESSRLGTPASKNLLMRPERLLMELNPMEENQRPEFATAASLLSSITNSESSMS